MKQKNQFWVNFIVRAILGMGIIFFTNQFFVYKEIALNVGFNIVSILIAGCLGLPGIVMLYGIVAMPIL